jgi:hypothetical protein
VGHLLTEKDGANDVVLRTQKGKRKWVQRAINKRGLQQEDKN